MSASSPARLPARIYPGTHFVAPLVQHLELYNVRDQIYSTTLADASKKGTVLKVYSKEGLPLGLGISVRYQLDPRRLPYMESNLPQPIESELLPAVVANAFRQIISGYMVRDVFSTKREEVRRAAADTITRRLASDGIVVKEVMLRDIDLPQEYAKGLEGLLVKAQENDRLSIEAEMKQKMVRTAELEAEADKVRQVKQSEARAQSTVLDAKAQADAMQYTLPLLLIQKIIAERLSDKVQIMMVPMDGKGFFANDVLKAATSGSGMSITSPNSH